MDASLDQAERLLRGMALLGESPARTLDALLATGEIVSAGIVTAALEARGIRARAQDVSAGGDVVRLLPPLNVSFPELEEGLVRDAFP